MPHARVFVTSQQRYLQKIQHRTKPIFHVFVENLHAVQQRIKHRSFIRIHAHVYVTSQQFALQQHLNGMIHFARVNLEN